MKLILPLLALITILVGCASSDNISVYDTTKRKATQQIDIFRDGEKPTRKYREIAMMGDEGRKAEQAGIEGRILAKARSMGANAIIFMPLEKVGDEVSITSFNLAESFAYKALIIVYE